MPTGCRDARGGRAGRSAPGAVPGAVPGADPGADPGAVPGAAARPRSPGRPVPGRGGPQEGAGPGPAHKARRGPWVSRRDGAGGGAGLGAVPGPGGTQPALRCAAAPEPGAAGQHPQRSPAHHHPHGHLRVPARPEAVAERDPPGRRENAASHPVLLPGIHHPSTASALPVLPSGTHRPGTAPDPAGSPLRYPPCHHYSGPARFSPPFPSAVEDALRMRAWLFPHLCPCCIPWLHQCSGWKSPPPSANRLLELLGRVRNKPAWLGAGAEQRLPNLSVWRGWSDPVCSRASPGRAGTWGLGWHKNRARLATLSEEQLHVLGHTTSALCFLINSGPCWNTESWGLDRAWSNLGQWGVSLSGQGVEQDEL